MKKSLITLIITLLTMAAQAQIKMHSDGRITFQTLANSTTQGISFGPAPDCGVDFNGIVNFHKAALFIKNAENYEWMCGSNNSNAYSKNWVVSYPNWNTNTFFVYGNGTACAMNHYTIDNNDGHAKGSESIDGKEAVSIIMGLKGYYFEPEEQEIPDLENNELVESEAVEAMYADFEKRSVALSGSNLKEAFPEAVRTDPQNRLCIDYQSVVTVLVEAVKEQQREIEELRSALEKVGKNK
jgi:hypothetical protein